MSVLGDIAEGAGGILGDITGGLFGGMGGGGLTQEQIEQLGEQQLERNIRAARESQNLNAIDLSSPWTNVTYQRDEAGNIIGQTAGLSDVGQQQFDLRNQLAQAFGRQGLDLLGGGGTASDYEQRIMDQALELMGPGFQREQEDLFNRMAQSGLPMGGEAFNRGLGEVVERQNRAKLATALDAIGQGRQARAQDYDMAMGGMGSLYGGPEMAPGMPSYGVQGVDVMGNVLQNQANQDASRGAMMGGLLGAAGTIGGSMLAGPVGGAVGGMAGSGMGRSIQYPKMSQPMINM